MRFGKQLRRERERNNLSAEELARLCGISRSYITLIENGKRLPGKKILSKIASALDIKTSVVLNWYLQDIKHKIHKDIEDSLQPSV